MMITILAADDADRLAELEVVVEAGIKTFAEVGKALLEIREKKLYCASHRTFEAYCLERWGMTRMHAGRMIAAAQVAENCNQLVTKPANEAQARPLTRLAPEEQPVAWQEAHDRAGAEGRTVTARDVEQVVGEKIDEKRKSWTRPTDDAVEDVEEAVEVEHEVKTSNRPVGLTMGMEAINILRRIPEADPMRLAGLEEVAKYIKHTLKGMKGK